MDSLYGGHEGASFVIKASFSSVDEMKQKFLQGSNFTEVWYGEYCLISTKNKNHPDNGKVFRRGLDYQNAQTAWIARISLTYLSGYTRIYRMIII